LWAPLFRREESQQIARSFEAASGEQREEIGRLMARVEDLTNRLQAGQTVIDGQEDEIQGLRQVKKDTLTDTELYFYVAGRRGGGLRRRKRVVRYLKI
jgi:hypothetical protein